MLDDVGRRHRVSRTSFDASAGGASRSLESYISTLSQDQLCVVALLHLRAYLCMRRRRVTQTASAAPVRAHTHIYTYVQVRSGMSEWSGTEAAAVMLFDTSMLKVLACSLTSFRDFTRSLAREVRGVRVSVSEILSALRERVVEQRESCFTQALVCAQVQRPGRTKHGGSCE